MSGPGLTEAEKITLCTCRKGDRAQRCLDRIAAVERILAARGVSSVQAYDDLRAAVERVRALTPMWSDEWPTTGAWLNRADVLDTLAASPAPTEDRGVGSDVIERLCGLIDDAAAALNVALHAATSGVTNSGEIAGCRVVLSRIATDDGYYAVLASSTPEDQSCACGHGAEYHDPRLPGCAECRCRRFEDQS